MKSTIDDLISRRSVRSYNSVPVDNNILDKILDAGMYAPSGMNRQDVIFVCVNDAETVTFLSKLNASVTGNSNDPFYGAKTVIMVLADRTCFTYLEDGSLAMGNLLNAAHAMGVESCWIHRAKEVSECEQGRAFLKKIGVPDNYIGIGNCILGYTDSVYPDAKPRNKNRIFKI